MPFVANHACVTFHACSVGHWCWKKITCTIAMVISMSLVGMLHYCNSVGLELWSGSVMSFMQDGCGNQRCALLFLLGSDLWPSHTMNWTATSFHYSLINYMSTACTCQRSLFHPLEFVFSNEPVPHIDLCLDKLSRIMWLVMWCLMCRRCDQHKFQHIST